MIGYFQEDENTESFSRLASFIVLVFTLAWSTYIVWKTTEIPNLTGPVGLIGILYGVNKASETISSLKKK